MQQPFQRIRLPSTLYRGVRPYLSSPGTMPWQAARIKGAIFSELVSWRFFYLGQWIRVVQTSNKFHGWPIRANERINILQPCKGPSRPTSQSSASSPLILTQNYHHRKWGLIELGQTRITHFLYEIQRVACTIVGQQLEFKIGGCFKKKFKWKTNGADIFVIAGWITVFIESCVATKMGHHIYYCQPK